MFDKRLLCTLLALPLLACSGEDTAADAGPEYELPQILPDIGLFCLNYELTVVNAPRNVPIAVRNLGRQQLTISSARVEGDDRNHFTLAGPDLDVVETYDAALFQLTYQPSAAGWDDVTVVVESNAENYPVLRLGVLARAVPEGLDGGADAYDAGPKPSADNADGGETCPDPEPDAGI